MTQQLTRSPSLARIRVADCMHHGVMTCTEDEPLRRVAQIMAAHRVHAVVVTTRDGGRPVGIVSDLDVTGAAATGAECTAWQAAATATLTVSGKESVERAAQMMSEHGVAHLVVVDSAGGYPVGVLSTLDIAVVYAGD
jgi:CBS domain-containing protein